MATRPRPSPYVEGGPNKFESFMNQLLGQTPNYAGYQPVYEDHVQQYEIDSGEAQPIDYVRQEYGTPPTGPDQEELAAQAGGPVADNRYETPATPQAIDDGSMDIWEGIPSTTVTPTATANGSGQVTIENENRINEMVFYLQSDVVYKNIFSKSRQDPVHILHILF